MLESVSSELIFRLKHSVQLTVHYGSNVHLVVLMKFASINPVKMHHFHYVILQLQDRLRETKFYGCIEDVKFDQVPIGLWDFVYGENLRGCSAR